ncbi:MAG: cob(I)yrinic acid a,c-diamide adenosyltransferase [Limisphaerales bacterium]
MSIATKTGDSGTTGLMYGRRVSKTNPRVEACGTIDELNSALGLARATAEHDFVRNNLIWIQKSLVDVMGEVGVPLEDLPRYAKDGYTLVTQAMTAKLDALVQEIEAQKVSFKGWATPGATMNSAALDVARTICRRSERSVCALKEAGELNNSEIIIYLNRLSDLLWLLRAGRKPKAVHHKTKTRARFCPARC